MKKFSKFRPRHRRCRECFKESSCELDKDQANLTCLCSDFLFAPNTYGLASKPELWFFGNTRTDAISGYFQAIGKEVQ